MKNVTSNSFPAMPIQNEFGSLGFPSTGLTKLEYFALEIYKTIYRADILPETLIRLSIEDSIKFLNTLESEQKNIIDETENTKPRIQS